MSPEALRRYLRDAGDLVDALDPPQQQTLARLIEAARAGQQQRIERALEQSLEFVPRIFRGAVRRILR